MSILSIPTNPPQTREAILNRKKNEITNAPRKMTREMMRLWNTAFDSLWTEETVDGHLISVADKLAELGTDAKELFDINTAFTTFMLTQLTGKRDDLVTKIQNKLSTIPSFTTHEDGTITLD